MPGDSAQKISQQTFSILLVEDDTRLAEVLCRQINAHEQLSLYVVASGFKDAMRYLRDDYDILVADKGLPDGSGIDLIRALNQREHTKKSVMMTVFSDEASVLEAIDAGVDGYVVKDDPLMLDMLCAVMFDGNPISPSVTKYFLQRLRHQVGQTIELTIREVETLQGLAEGLKYQEIAEHLGLSKHTVPDYIKTLYRKLGVHDRSSAVYVGLRKGIIR